MSQFVLEDAEKIKGKARIGLQGPAGTGKTYSALVIAQHLLVDGKMPTVAVIDTENKRSMLYAKKWLPFRFKVIDLKPPYTPLRYVDAVHFCEDQGMDVIIVDSLSHAWMGEGGALEMVDSAKARFGNNSHFAWRDVTPAHNKLVNAILQSPVHQICCLRTKTKYVEEEDNRGKKTYVKRGVEALQKEGMDYEFDIVFELDLENRATVTKTRFDELHGKFFQPIDAELGQIINHWLDDGAPAPEKPKTQADLVSFAKTKDPRFDGKAIGAALKAAGITAFDPEYWAEMVVAIDAYKFEEPQPENGKVA